MSRLLNLITGHGRQARDVQGTLERLDRERLPVRVEIENANVHFYTRLSLKSATVVLAKPAGLREALKKGAIVRFRVPGEEGREVRMEVVTPHFNLSNGNAVFLCNIPDTFVARPMRAADRFNTTRFNNVRMVLPIHTQPLRVVDLSISGCRLYVPSGELMQSFTVGEPIPECSLHLGDRVRVNLDALIPRNLRAPTVGCEMQVASQGNAHKVLQHLIDSLEKAEADKLRG